MVHAIERRSLLFPADHYFDKTLLTVLCLEGSNILHKSVLACVPHLHESIVNVLQ